MRKLDRFLLCTFALLIIGGLGSAHAAEEEHLAKIAGVPGGLCLYFDCDGAQAIDVVRSGSFLVHSLHCDSAKVPSARKTVSDAGLAPFVCVESWPTAPQLPYEKNHISLVVAENLPALIAKGLTIAEIVRVLNPLGKACLGGVSPEDRAKIESALKAAGVPTLEWKGANLVFQKPWPKEMGDWTHFFHGSDGNRVADDTYLAPPNQVQWMTDTASKLWVVGKGKAFLHLGDAIVCKDAGSGVILWRKPVNHTKIGKTLLVIDGNVLTAHPDGPGKPSVLVSGETGEIIRNYGGLPYGMNPPLHEQGLLLCDWKMYEVASGNVLWSLDGNNKDGLKPKRFQYPGTPRGQEWGFDRVLSKGRIFFRDATGELVVLNARTGKIIARKDLSHALGNNDYILEQAFDGNVLLHSEIREKPYTKESPACMGAARFTAVNGKDGSILWQHEIKPTPLAPTWRGQCFRTANRMWISRWGDNMNKVVDPVKGPIKGPSLSSGADPQPGVWEGLDQQTGKILQTLTMPRGITWHCGMVTATNRFYTGNRPNYFVDWSTGKLEGRFGVTRVPCDGIGHFAAQGLFFASGGWGCGCVRTAMGCQGAFSSDEKTWDGTVEKAEHPTESGSAQAPELVSSNAEDWPMYRHDMLRSAASPSAIADGLSLLWECAFPRPNTVSDSPIVADWANWQMSGALAQPVVADGRVFTSVYQTKQVAAITAKTGKVEWTYDLPALASTSPTIAKGLALVGCHDGWVYALRADNGALVWRTRIAPADRRIVAHGQLESTWPVVGGVLLAGDRAYALAGRTTEADGGLYIVALEPATGRILWTGRRYLNNPGDIGPADHERYETLGTGAADLLASDGKSIVFGSKVTRKGGFDNATGADGPSFSSPRVSLKSPYITAIGKDLFVINSKKNWSQGGKLTGEIAKVRGWKIPWTEETLSPIALVAAKDHLIAGVSIPAQGKATGELWMINPSDGKKITSIPLAAAPVTDGISVANGRIYIATENGKILCFGK